MFRDDAQACRAIRAFLSIAQLEALWGDQGPTDRAASLHRHSGHSLTAQERVILQAAWTFWRPTQGRVRLGQVLRTLDRGACEALCSLLVAHQEGPDAIDAWLGGSPLVLGGAGPSGDPAEGEASPTMVTWLADWPTIDDISIRYIHRVIAREGGNKTRAAVVLGVDRRTLVRILARDIRRHGMGRPRAG